jgi:hypothetical protein
MWLLTLAVVAQTVSVGTPIHRPSVGAGKSRSPGCEAKADTHRTPSETQAAVGGLLEKPQIAGIELLRVLIANERKDRTSSTGSESKARHQHS